MFKKISLVQKIFTRNGILQLNKLPSSVLRVLSTDNKSTSESPTLTGLSPKNKVIIIGAGVAGLSAADHLIQNGTNDILILEAAERYGGRIHTAKLGDAICELGAKWINANETPDSVFSLAKQGGLVDRKSFDNNSESFFLINRESMDEELVQLTTIMFRDLVKASEAYMVGDIPSDHRTVDTYLKDRIKKILSRMPKSEVQTAQHVFDALMRNLSCQLGTDLAYIHVKQLSNLAKHLDKPIYIPSGLDKVLNQLVKKIPVDRMLLGKPIGGIRWANLDANQPPYVTCLDGTRYLADHILCTIPLGALSAFSQHFFIPSLPDAKVDAIQKLGRGSPGKIYLRYKEPVTPWFIGSLMLGPSTDNSHASRDNWTAGISEISVVPDSRNVLEVRVGGSSNDTVERCAEDLVEKEVTTAIRKIMKNNKIPPPVEMLRSFWSTDARTLCGLPYISIGTNEICIGDLAAPLYGGQNSKVPTLLFAGDATSFEGFGSVEGARLSGIREAKRILEKN